MPGMKVWTSIVVVNVQGVVSGEMNEMPAPWDFEAGEYTNRTITRVMTSSAWQSKPLMTDCEVIVMSLWKGKTRTTKTNTRNLREDLLTFWQDFIDEN